MATPPIAALAERTKATPPIAALAELSASALVATDLTALLYQAAALVASALSVRSSAIWELHPESDALVLAAGVGWPNPAPGGTLLGTVSSALIADLLHSPAPVVVPDWFAETRSSQPDVLRQQGVRCSLFAAIAGQDQPFGVLSAESTTQGAFTAEETHFVQGVAHILAIAIDRTHVSQTLAQREARLVAAAQEKGILEERQRLARDLHDSVTQALYGVTLHVQAATRLLAAGDVATVALYLRELQSTAEEALEEMRLLIFELRPPILEQAGLAAAVQARLDAVEGRANLKTRLIGDEVGRLPAPVEQVLYRIVQEALNNVLKHAHARQVTVHLQQVPAMVRLGVADDGVGFDPAIARPTGGMGLRGIAERVDQIGGRLILHSAPGAGTTLQVEVDL